MLDFIMVMIPGPEGALEGRYHFLSSQGKMPIALIIPPHPEHEGTMDHPVVHTLFRTFAGLGMNVLRFNFRGAGNSQGTFVNGEGEVSDAASALDWLHSKNVAPSQCWVAGFSFGAYIALQLLMRRPECNSFVAINPLVNLYDFSFLAPCPTEGLVIHSEHSIVPKESIVRLTHQLALQKRGHPITLKGVSGADHEFTGHYQALEEIIYSHVQEKMQRPSLRASSFL